MKKDIHPKYFTDAKIICACGHQMTVGSTVKEIHVEICSSCHPFYTGKEKLVDTAGRVDRFKKIQALQKQVSSVRKGRAAKKEKSAERKIAKERAKMKAEISANTINIPKHAAKKTAARAKVVVKKPGKK